MSSRRRMLLSNNLKSKGVIDGVIQDDLKTLVKICQKGLAPKFYTVGDHVSIPLSGIGTFYFDYLGSNLETRSDGKTKPVSSWLCRSIPTASKWIDDDASYASKGWVLSTIRNHCRTTIYNALPDVIRNNIVEVNKPTNDVITSDTVWVPSTREIFTVGNREPLYKERFPTMDSRVKNRSPWWMRDFYDVAYVRYVSSTGSPDYYYGNKVYGVVPGFCL